MDVSAWLGSLGLACYKEAFRDNAIDHQVLPELTADDLKELGVRVVGHRRKLLVAIAALRDDIAATTDPTTAPAPARERAAGAVEAERRQLTVLMCDLVGSTALAATFDPEDLREIISAYHRQVAGVIERFEGHVAKYMGDGILAYFGYPRAYEDNAERAVRAGLELLGAVAGLRSHGDTALQLRVGIATGLVVVGDLIGEGAAREEVVGETPNLAARLQTLAAPGSVLIAATTRQLVGGLFELIDAGEHRLKGFALPVPAWQVAGASPAESRFEALHGVRLSPLVGREHELAVLLERWQWAKEGDGQVVLLSGEPGIGKSRLLRALRERLAGEPHTALRHHCSAYHQNSALHPVIGLLERAAGLDRNDPPELQLAALEALLARATDRRDEAVPLLADLLSVRCDARAPPLDLGPARRKQRTLEVLVEQLEGLAARQPVLAVYEDVHWIDPTSLELLSLVVQRSQHLPVLVVISFRPEFVPPWNGQAHVTQMPLNRLAKRHGATMVGQMTAKTLPAEILAEIVAKTDGVPLFIEELTKAVLEAGILRDAGSSYEVSGRLSPLAIPTTLKDSLMARLDRLAPVREVAQIGAVIGREFSHELLAAVAPLAEAELCRALDQLVGAELAFRRGTRPQAIYSFKHALVQDAAYQSLLRSRRLQLHARIAGVLQERFPALVEAEPEIVAHHCTQAGLTGDAVRHWQRAGELATARSAMKEALAHLERALELLATLPDTTARREQELALRTSQGAALIAVKGLAAAEVADTYARAHALSAEVGATASLLPALCGQYWFQSQRGQLGRALATAQEVLRIAEEQNETGPLVIGHRIVGTSLFHLGRFGEARPHLECVLDLYDPRHHRSLAAAYTFDPRVLGSLFLSLCLYCLGHPDQARARRREALDDAEAAAHPHSLAHALAGAAMLGQLMREPAEVVEKADALIALAAEQGFPFWLAIGRIFRGWALAEAGDGEQGIDLLRQGLVEYRATGAELWAAYFLGLLAEACERAGQADEAAALLEQAVALAEESGASWSLVELHGLRAGCLLASGPRHLDAAEAGFRQAMALAGAQAARMWELRAATDLARLLARRGEQAVAHDLLAPAYGWFTEGFDTPDLKEAKAVLDELQ